MNNAICTLFDNILIDIHKFKSLHHEIAEKMELPLGTVKSRIFFARQRLQEMLKDYK